MPQQLCDHLYQTSNCIMMVSVSQFPIQVDSATYRLLNILVNSTPLPSTWIILTVASLFPVQIGHHRRSITATMSCTGCFKSLSELARNHMTIMNAFYR